MNIVISFLERTLFTHTRIWLKKTIADENEPTGPGVWTDWPVNSIFSYPRPSTRKSWWWWCLLNDDFILLPAHKGVNEPIGLWVMLTWAVLRKKISSTDFSGSEYLKKLYEICKNNCSSTEVTYICILKFICVHNFFSTFYLPKNATLHLFAENFLFKGQPNPTLLLLLIVLLLKKNQNVLLHTFSKNFLNKLIPNCNTAYFF